MRELLHGLNALQHDRETLSQVPRAAQSHPWIKPVRPSRTPEALNHRMWKILRTTHCRQPPPSANPFTNAQQAPKPDQAQVTSPTTAAARRRRLLAKSAD